MPIIYRNSLFVILILLLAGGAVFGGEAWFHLSQKQVKVAEAQRPADVQITAITVSDCPDCYSLKSAIDAIAAQPFTVQKEIEVASTSTEARALIQKYNIQRLPTLVITGEIDKQNVHVFLSANTDLRDGALVWSIPQPVYIDPATGKAVGRVTVTVINDPACTDCTDVASYLDQLDHMGMKQKASSTLNWRSPKARKLIAAYGLTSIPALILSPEAGLYPSIKRAWKRFGTSTADGTFVASIHHPPYVELPQGKVRGRVSVTYVADASCLSCYNVAIQQKILQQKFGVSLSHKSTVDVMSAKGKRLIKTYKITSVPTFVLTGDYEAYPSLMKVLPSVGSIEANGSYVFRDDAQIGTYKDLTTGKVVTHGATSSTGT